MHISEADQKNWIQERAEATARGAPARGQEAHPRPAQRSGGVRAVPALEVPGEQAVLARGGRERDPDARLASSRTPRTRGMLEAVIGMSHRGRLNVLANIVGKPLARDLQGVRRRHRSRLGAGFGRREVPPRHDRDASTARSGENLGVVLASNPSHLEAVDPIVVGMARAKQDMLGVGFHGQGAPDPAPRRCSVRRTGGRGRDAATLRGERLPGRRDDPHRREQPDRIHDRAQVRPLHAPTRPTSPR